MINWYKQVDFIAVMNCWDSLKINCRYTDSLRTWGGPGQPVDDIRQDIRFEVWKHVHIN